MSDYRSYSEGKVPIPQVAKAGSVLMIDDGSYSGQETIGMFVVLQDFEPYAVLRDYLEANTEQKSEGRNHSNFKRDMFLAFLLRRGVLLELSYGTLWMGERYANAVGFYP